VSRVAPTRGSRHFRLESLGRGVYAAVATPTGHGVCNAGILDLGDCTVVFDAMLSPAAAVDLARAAERCTGRRPDWVVNSHWHGDHVWGNPSFPQAHIVSTHRTRTEIRRRGAPQLTACRREFPKLLAGLDRPDSPIPPRERPGYRGWFEAAVRLPPSFRIVAPDVTFTEELVLEGSRRSVRLLSYGGGHSPSDVFAFLPDERLLFGGDLAMVGMHPSVTDGWTDRWIAILRRIERLRPDRVLPGHGHPGTGRDLELEVDYLRELERIVAAAGRDGLSLQELRGTPVPDRFSSWLFSPMFPDNLERVHRLARPSRRRRRSAA